MAIPTPSSISTSVLNRHGNKLESARVYPDVFPLNSTDFVLNVGCGKATQMIPYKGQFKGAVGIDINFQRLHFAKQTCTALDLGEWNSCLSDVHRLPLESAIFDVCLAIDVIEHALYPKILLEEIHRVLKPGGQLMITFPTLYDSWIRLFIKLQKIGIFKRYNLSSHYNFTLENGQPNPDAHHQEKTVNQWMRLVTDQRFVPNKVVASTLFPPLHRVGIPKIQYSNNKLYTIDRFFAEIFPFNRLGQATICIFTKN